MYAPQCIASTMGKEKKKDVAQGHEKKVVRVLQSKFRTVISRED